MEHDSLEDYLNLSEKVGKDTKKTYKDFAVSAQKRKECERKALEIVQLCLQRSVDVDFFLKSTGYINHSYYEDICEERAILQFCGYVLCRKKITISKHRFKINKKCNKVYDMNEYGNFCSTFCFNASNHIKSQILDSPLWMRDVEDVPLVNLLTKNVESVSGSNITSKKKVEQNEVFTTISSFAKLSLDDVGDIEFSVSALSEQQKISTERTVEKKSNINKLSTVIEETPNVNDHLEPKKSNRLKNESANLGSKEKIIRDTNESGKSNLNINNSNIRKRKTVPDLKSITSKIRNKMAKPCINLIEPLPLKMETNELIRVSENHVQDKNESRNSRSLIELKFSSKNSGDTEKTIQVIFRKWICLETLLLIHGEDKIKQILDENKLSEQFNELRVGQLKTEQQHRYLSICQRLCEQEIFEEKFETLLLENNLKPIPDYKQLKSESKEFDIKVRNFLKGELHESNDKNFGPTKSDKSENLENEPAFMPLFDDKNCQNAQRQKILSESLSKTILFLLDYIKYESTYVLADLKGLIKTFKLDAESIVFKPVIRNYIGFICLKILSLKDDLLSKELEKAEFLELEHAIFEQLPGKKSIMNNILGIVNDVNRFLETYVSTLE